ncbi:hypothetical protein ACOSP7_013048 [Xanthoceras sorbifolium]
MFTTRGFDKIIVEINLLPLAMLTVVDVEDHAPQANSTPSSYRRTPGQNTMSNDIVDISTDDEVSNEVQFDEEEYEDLNSFAAENAVEDEVLEDTELGKDVLSDATSFD